MSDKNEKTDQKKVILGLTIYGIILLALIIVYRDFMITATAIVVFIVFLVLHYAPRIREQREREKEKEKK